MVAHTRKTPGAGPLRPVKPKAIKPIAPGSIDQGAQFRPLDLPVPIEVVESRMERPVSVTLPPTNSSRPARSRRPGQATGSPAAPLTVTAINDLWQVDDEWWRDRPISRRYYQLTTQDAATKTDRRLTIFRDQLNGDWYWQRGG